MSTDIIVSIE